MTQLEMAIAAQENPWQDLLWFDWRYMPDDTDIEWSGMEDDEPMVDWYGEVLPLSHFIGHEGFEDECPDCDEDDAEWLRDQGIIDEDGFVVDSLEFDDFDFEE